jgi:6-methylsalicylate decarboxylase
MRAAMPATERYSCRRSALTCSCCLSRRGALAGFAAVAASTVLPAAPAPAQAPARKLTRIDVHRHFVPPGYVVDRTRTWLNDRSTIAQQLEDMDKSGVALAVISVSVPDLEARDSAEARRFSRLANEFSAKLVADHPGRFGLFAYLPFPDVDGTLKEIEYALDTLKADGVYLRTNYDTKFLGDPVFAPVFEAPRRGALHAPDEPPLLCAHCAGPARRRHRIRHQHDARHCQDGVLGRLAALSKHESDLVARRRNHAVSCAPLHQARAREP